MPFITFPAGPLLGYIGDKIGYKIMCIVALFLNALCSIVFTLIPQYSTNIQHKIEITSIEDILNPNQEVMNFFKTFSEYSANCSESLDFTITKLVCDEEDYDINYRLFTDNFINVTQTTCDDKTVCKYFLDTPATISENTKICNVYIKGFENVATSGNASLLFWLYLVIEILNTYATRTAPEFVNAFASKSCEKVGIDWAWVNVIGNLGALVGPFITTLLINKVQIGDVVTDCLSGDDISDYRLPFYFCSGFIALTAIITFFTKIESEPAKRDVKWWKEFSWMLTLPAISYFFTLFVNGVVFGAELGVYPIYLVDHLNVTDEWWGIIYIIGTFGTISMIAFAGLIHKHVGSMNVICIFSFIWSVKIIVVSYLNPVEDEAWPWGPIVTSVLYGNEPIYVGVIGYVSLIAPSYLRASALGFSSLALYVVGGGIGSLIGGYVSDQVGLQTMFRIFGFAGLGYQVVFTVLYHIIIKHREKKPEAATEVLEKI